MIYAHLPKRPRKSLKLDFPFLGSQGIGSTLKSFQMIFEALQSQLFRFSVHTLSSKILKIQSQIKRADFIENTN